VGRTMKNGKGKMKERSDKRLVDEVGARQLETDHMAGAVPEMSTRGVASDSPIRHRHAVFQNPAVLRHQGGSEEQRARALCQENISPMKMAVFQASATAHLVMCGTPGPRSSRLVVSPEIVLCPVRLRWCSGIVYHA
jgi:hypothetical protein